jgi:hypothetical protein
MAREIRWSRGSSYGEVKWTAKTRPEHAWYRHNVDLSFTLEAAKRGGVRNTNARLIVRKRLPNKKVADHVILTREFKNSYEAKDVIDSLIYLSKVLKHGEDGEEWFLEQLKNFKGAPLPDITTGTIYNPGGYAW